MEEDREKGMKTTYSVIGSSAEHGWDRGQVVCLEEVLKVAFDLVGTRGAREVEGTAVAVVDAVDVVRAGNL